MQRIVLRYGLIAGAVMAAGMIMTFVLLRKQLENMSGSLGMVIGYTTMIVAMLSVYFGVRTYRDTVRGGSIGFWPAAGIGMLICAIGAACYVATWEVIYRNFLPGYADKFGQEAVKAAQAKGATEAEVAKTRQEMAKFAEDYKKPMVRIGFTILEPLPVALLMSLISAGVLSRKRRDPLSTQQPAVS
jgi:Protein of unknown function (DUF4199)